MSRTEVVPIVTGRIAVAAIGLASSLVTGPATAQEPAAEQGPDAMRAIWPGIDPAGGVLLPNGWSLRPAGRQVALGGDFPVLIAPHPGEPVLALLFAGYRAHEVVTADAESGDVIARVTLPASFSGLAWSPDGDRLFAGGGFDDVIYRFDHAEGLLSNQFVFQYPGPPAPASPAPDDEQDVRQTRQRVPGGLALSGGGKTLWVANTWGHTVARFDAESGEFLGETGTGDGTFPYGVAVDEAKDRAYVSLWAAMAVSVIDLKSAEVVARWPTEEHPNELRLARERGCSTSPT